MCRLPVELMVRIVELVRQPLPEIGDPKATMKELCQNNLASLMRVSKVTSRSLLHTLILEPDEIDDLLLGSTAVVQGSGRR